MALRNLFSGSSPLLQQGEERFSAPKNACDYRGALALGSSSGVCDATGNQTCIEFSTALNLPNNPNFKKSAPAHRLTPPCYKMYPIGKRATQSKRLNSTKLQIIAIFPEFPSL